MDLGLKGKTALITGGSKGIGYAIGEMMAGEGCNIILVARNADDLASARNRIVALYPEVEVFVHPADLSTAAAATEMAAAFPDIDILINNAGAIQAGTLEEVDEELWHRYWSLKVYGYINMTRAYYTLMKARRRGVIINIIGMAGEKLQSYYIAGSTGNASLIAFTKSMGGESPAYGVRIVGINPGPVLTEKLLKTLRLKATQQFGDAERWPELVKNMPFGRSIKPVEISATVALLASDLSGYTSGEVINIDGGALFNRS